MKNKTLMKVVSVILVFSMFFTFDSVVALAADESTPSFISEQIDFVFDDELEVGDEINADSVEEESLIEASISELVVQELRIRSVKFTFPETSEKVSYKFHNNSTESCFAFWWGGLRNNTRTLIIFAKKTNTKRVYTGKSDITVCMENKTTGEIIDSKTISVRVTPYAPDISDSLNYGNAELKIGQEMTFTVNKYFTDGEYKLIYESGDCISCEKEDDANIFTIKGLKKGKTTLRFKLMRGCRVFDRIPIKINVTEGEIPEFRVTPDKVDAEYGLEFTATLYRGDGLTEGTEIVLCTGNCDININDINENIRQYNIKKTSCQAGEYFSFQLCREKDKKTLAVANVFIVADSSRPDFEELNEKTERVKDFSFNFKNDDSFISWDTFVSVYGKSLQTYELYKCNAYTGGVCAGMAMSAMTLEDGSIFTPEYFGAKTIYELSKFNGKNKETGMSLKNFIDTAQAVSFSKEYAENKIYDLQALCEKVKSGESVMVHTYNETTGGHLTVAYRLDEENGRLYVSDSNFPGKPVYISVNKNADGEYTEWSFDHIYKYYGWNQDNGKIAFLTMESINYLWNNITELEINEDMLF